MSKDAVDADCFAAGMGKLWPEGHMRPVKFFINLIHNLISVRIIEHNNNSNKC